MLSDTYFRDAEGNYYMVQDVAALGDCAVLAVLCHPNFKVPLGDVQELRRAVVSFAQGPGEAECSRVYSLLRSKNADTFHVYVQRVLQPRFWVGTEFFVWVSMLYGVEVKVYYFGADKIPTLQSTRYFLERVFPDCTYFHPNPDIVQILFHQYGRINSCHYPSFNHFAMLISFPCCPENSSLLNDSVVGASEIQVPWWNKANTDGASEQPMNKKEQRTNKKVQKTIKKKSGMSKVELKSRQASITSSYLHRMSTSSKKASELDKRLKEAHSRALELAQEQKISVDDLDLPVKWSKNQEPLSNASVNTAVVKPRSLSPQQCHRSWFQRSFIIFMYLHPRIGCKDVDFTSALTGVKKNTLIGWLSKPNLISCWLPIVASYKASDIVGALPGEYKEIFQDIVNGNSQVSLTTFAQKAKKAKGTQLKISFTGIDVSSSIHCVLFVSVYTTNHITFP